MSLGEVDQALMSLRDNIDKPPPYQDRIDNPMLYPYLTNEDTGNIETHKMAQMDNYAFPMVQLQDYAYEKFSSKRKTRSLKDFGDDKFKAWEAAKKTGNFKKFDTVEEAKAYAEKGTWKTDDFKDYYKKISPGDKYPPQQVSPEYYFEPGLGEVAPVIEFGFSGLARAGTSAVAKTKMYSDQIVDRFTKIKTPKKTYHGGEANVNPLKATYDRAKEGQKIDNIIPYRVFGDEGGEQVVKELDKIGYSPFQSALYTGTKDVAVAYGRGPNKSLYEIDISSVKKIFDTNKPSKFIKGKLNKEIKIAEKSEDGWRAADLRELRGEKYLSHLTESQRQFLEKYGYEAVKTIEQHGVGNMGLVVDKPAILLLRPEKYKIKELLP